MVYHNIVYLFFYLNFRSFDLYKFVLETIFKGLSKIRTHAANAR